MAPFMDDGGRGVGMPAGAVESDVDIDERSRLPPGHHVIQHASFALAGYQLLAFCCVPALVLAAVESSHSYLLLFLGEILLAISALEWSWLAYRIRRKLLFTLHAPHSRQHDTSAQQTRTSSEGDSGRVAGHERSSPDRHAQVSNSSHISLPPPLPPHDVYVSVVVAAPPPPASSSSRFAQRTHAMQATQYAIEPLASYCCSRSSVLAAIVVACTSAGTLVGVVYCIEHSVFSTDHPMYHRLGSHMLIAVTAAGTFVGVFTGCYAPTTIDGIVVAITNGCFMASSLNSLLFYFADALDRTELLDPLFIVLVGACVVVVVRVTTSTSVLESLLFVASDTTGIVVITAPMLAAADFVVHPHVALHRDKLALFILVVLASEIGAWFTAQLATCAPAAAHKTHWWSWRRSVSKPSTASRSKVPAAVGAVAFGALMLPLSLVWTPYSEHAALDSVEVVVLLAALVVGQLARFVMASVKDVAEVSTTGFYLPRDARVGGVLDHMAVFLVATIVYHPYIKHVVYT